MTGLAERLDTLAREATGAVELMPAELAARARRRHRIRTSVAAAALAACAAGVMLYADTGSPGARKVVGLLPLPASRRPPLRPLEECGPSSPLSHAGRRLQFGDASPSTERAVATDLAGFQRSTGTGGSSLSFDPAVYFIQMTGEFTDWSYLGPGPDLPHETVPALAVERPP